MHQIASFVQNFPGEGPRTPLIGFAPRALALGALELGPQSENSNLPTVGPGYGPDVKFSSCISPEVNKGGRSKWQPVIK